MEKVNNTQDEIKKIKSEIKKLDKNTKYLEIEIKKAILEIDKVEKFKNSDNSREKMIYLEAVRRSTCLNNDLVNTNLMITFKLDELELLQSKLQAEETQELSR